jgi:hypothetical protein
MAKQEINLGSAPNAGDGDPLRTAFNKINENFDELYNTSGGLDLLNVASNVIPATDNTYDLGSPAKRWKHGYFATGSLYVGDLKLSNDGGTLLVQQVTNAGLITEAPIPDNPGVVTTDRIINGANTFSITAAGELELNGQPFTGSGGLSIADFGEGFTDSLDDGKITTSKLYNENPNPGLNNQYTLEVTNGGVVVLPDQSIINGATLKTVAGNYAGITAGPVGRDEDSWMWVDSDGAWIATDYSDNAYTWKFKNNGNLELPKNKQITLPVSTDENRYGGDINIMGQRGYGDWSTAGNAGWGSSIYIRSGDGGENNVSDQGGEGGEVWIRSGDGQAGNNGGTASLIAGSAKYNNSGSAIYGGNVHVTAGNAQESASGLGQGGNVNINAGEGDQTNGVVNINTVGGDNTWTFDAVGTLNIPSIGDIKRGGISVLLSELEIDGGNANTPELGELIIDGNNGA